MGWRNGNLINGFVWDVDLAVNFFLKLRSEQRGKASSITVGERRLSGDGEEGRIVKHWV